MKIELYEKSDIAEGFLTIEKIYLDGTRETILKDDPNVITRKSKREHLTFLFDKNAKPNIINAFKIGSGGTYDEAGRKPIRPDPNRNDLYNPITTYNKNIHITPSTPADTQGFLMVDFVLGPDEANDKFISEVGLFKENGDMFNLKTFRAVPKVDSFSLQFWWRILYA